MVVSPQLIAKRTDRMGEIIIGNGGRPYVVYRIPTIYHSLICTFESGIKLLTCLRRTRLK